MAATTATLPFSLMMEQERAGANGLTIGQAVSEFIDNGFDAGSSSYNIAIITKGEKMYVVFYDEGSGAANLLQLYSLGNDVRRKSGAVLGLKNYGHRAAVGRLSPTTVTHITRATGALRASSLVLSLGDLYDAIDAAKRAGDCNYRRIDESLNGTVIRHTPNGGLNDEIRDLLTDALSGMTEEHDAARTFLHGVTANTAPSYHMMVMEFPHAEESLIAEIKDAMRSYRMTYCHALREGKSIHFMAFAAAISLTAADAIDPLGSAPRITGAFEFRVAAGITYIQLTLEGRPVWYMYRSGDRLFYDGKTGRLPLQSAADVKPTGWDAAAPAGHLDLACSVPSADEENKQKTSVGANVYKSVDDMRGVYLRYHNRYLGTPVYNDTNWEATRNVCALRVELVAHDPETAENFMGIQTKKNTSSFDAMAPSLQLVLNWLCQRVIISKYSHYKLQHVVKGQQPGVKDWNLEYFWRLLLNGKAEKPRHAPAITVTDESDDESVESGSVISLEISDVASTASGEPAPAPAPAKIKVAGTSRTVPISLQQALALVVAEIQWYANSNIDELAQTAGDTAIAGLATVCNNMRAARETLMEHGLALSN